METLSIRTLPDEVLARIFSHLSQSDILRRVLPVCQRWQAVAQSQVLSKWLAFTFPLGGYSTEETLRLIEGAPNLRSLELTLWPKRELLLKAVGSLCTKLQRLRVEVCWNKHAALATGLLTVFRSCSQHLTDLTLVRVHIADSLPFCQELCTALPNLRRLTIIDCEWFGPAELDAVIDGCPHMQQFKADCLCSDANIIRMGQRWGSSLQMLDLWALELSDAGVTALAGCSQLRSLQLYLGTSSVRMLHLEPFGDWMERLGTSRVSLQQLASLDQLEQFSLSQSDGLDSQNICQFFTQSRSAGRLRKISLRFCCNVDDSVLTALAAACPSVEDVDLFGCERVTAAGVLELLGGCRRLLQLSVSGTDLLLMKIRPFLPWLAPQLRISANQITYDDVTGYQSTSTDA